MITAATNPNVVVVPATNPNVVVVPAPDPPAIHANYASTSSHVLGGIQIAVGTVLIIANIVVISTYGAYWGTGSLFNHFGAGGTFLIAGGLGIGAGLSKTSCFITAFMVLSIISSVVAVSNAFVYVIVASAADFVEQLDTSNDYWHIVVAVIYTLVALFFIESVASIWASAICCNAVCCGRRSSGGAIIHNSYVPLQTAPTVITTTQGPLQTGISPMSFGPPPVY
ncbi:hypothetical protein LSAT2_016432 [Lamellibrachia satsuma]|nr:hypothetical protein LSAT2_016432 [Lamellibrachia satsuma]